MFIARFKQIVLILTIGIGLGILVPMVMMHFPARSSSERLGVTDVLSLPGNEDHVLNHDYSPNLLTEGNFHVRVQDGILSIVRGEPQSGEIILSGLNIKHWPKDMQSMVTQVEFHSFDEVQSFIDSISEELWIE